MFVFFMCGILSGPDYDEIIYNSKGSVQNAADVLQCKIIDGFSHIDSVESLNILNLPYINSFPLYYKRMSFKTDISEFKKGRINYFNVNFCNIFILKNISRFFNSFIKSFRILNNLRKEEILFFIYAMHLPFLLAGFFLKLLFPNVKFYVIVPDLPEYMAVRRGLSAIIFNFFGKLSYYLVNKLHGVVLLTEQMKSKFSPRLKSVVMEGISSQSDFLNICDDSINKENFFFYSGTLDTRYGLGSLINSFNKLSLISDVELYICGDGPDKKLVKNATVNNPKIKYLGLLPRNKVLILQKKAKLLINPRKNDQDFTNFSFPSKTLEYMSSGTPVLMYKLSGIPLEYSEYIYMVETDEQFLESMVKISQTDSEILKLKGMQARLFVEQFKNPKSQIEKILKALG